MTGHLSRLEDPAQRSSYLITGISIPVKQYVYYIETGSWMKVYNKLAPKHWEMHGCVVSTVATDTLVLKHQAISSHNAD